MRGCWKSLVLGGVVLMQGLAPQAKCQAGPLTDWLFHRQDTQYAQPIYGQPVVAPPAVVAPAPAVSPCSPCQGATTYYAPAPTMQACAPCQRATTYYAPDPYYRTTWTRMPVTNYRPVMAASPTAGYPVVTMQPCNTNIWQARRVPSYAFHPIYSGYAPAPAPGCSTCGAAPTAAPYYSPATPTMVGPAVSSGVVTPGASTPGMTVPGPASSPAVVPADVAPSLSPGGLPPASGPTIRNFTPLDSVSPPVEPEGPSLDPLDGVPLNSPAAVQKKPAQKEPAAPGLRLVPDPDVPNGGEPNRAPRLLTPREKTAGRSLRPMPPSESGAVRPASVESAVPAAPRATKPAEEKWDDSGWRSLQP